MQTKHSRPALTSKHHIVGPALLIAVTGLFLAPHCEANPAGDVHFKKGLQLSQQKKWAQAEAEYRQAIALDPKNATYRSYLADALAAQGKFDQAQTNYKQSSQIKKNTSKVTPQKSTASKPGKARTSTSKPPTPPRTRGGVPQLPGGGNSSTTSRNGGGTPKFPVPKPPVIDSGDDGDDDGNGEDPGFTVGRNDGITIGGNDGDFENNAHFLKGQEYGDNGNWVQAEREYVIASKEKPQSSAIWGGLGDVRYQLGKYQTAESAHRQAVRCEADEPYYHAQLGMDLLKLGRRAEAQKEAKEAQRLGLDDHELFDELGMATH